MDDFSGIGDAAGGAVKLERRVIGCMEIKLFVNGI
jgi:hypothetical protein